MASGAAHTPSPRRSRRVDGVRAVPYSTEGQRASQRRPLDASRRRRRGEGRTPRTHHLARELGTTSQLELADHESFRVVRRTALIEQSLRELVPVDLREEIFIGEIGEQLHRLLEERFHVFISQLFASRLENAVTKRRHELRVRVLAHVPVREFDEGLLERFLEERVAPELLTDYGQVLVVQC